MGRSGGRGEGTANQRIEILTDLGIGWGSSIRLFALFKGVCYVRGKWVGKSVCFI